MEKQLHRVYADNFLTVDHTGKQGVEFLDEIFFQSHTIFICTQKF